MDAPGFSGVSPPPSSMDTEVRSIRVYWLCSHSAGLCCTIYIQKYREYKIAMCDMNDILKLNIGHRVQSPSAERSTSTNYITCVPDVNAVNESVRCRPWNKWKCSSTGCCSKQVHSDIGTKSFSINQSINQSISRFLIAIIALACVDAYNPLILLMSSKHVHKIWSSRPFQPVNQSINQSIGWSTSPCLVTHHQNITYVCM